MSVAVAQLPATISDLARVTGKAELISGRLVPSLPSGYRPNILVGRIFGRLADHANALGVGVAFTDNMGFTVPTLSTGRESFSPDAAYHTGPPPTLRCCITFHPRSVRPNGGAGHGIIALRVK